MLEWLKAILGDKYTDEIDKKVSEEIGKNFVARTDFNTLNAEKKSLTDSLKDRDKQLETLKASTGDVEALKAQITQLQADNLAATKAHEAEVKRLKIDTAVELALSAAKAKNIKAVKALLELDKAELADDGTVKGLADQIKKLAEAPESGFLFEAKEKPQKNFTGFKPGESGEVPPSGAMTLENFRKLSPAERLAFSTEHPEDYKKLYGGNS